MPSVDLNCAEGNMYATGGDLVYVRTTFHLW